MGACYSVYLKIKFDQKVDLNKAAIDLNNLIATDTDVKYGIEKLYPNYNKESILDFVLMLVASHQDFCEIKVNDLIEGKLEIVSHFDARYSWENVLYMNFKRLAKYCESGTIDVYPDNRHVKLIVKNYDIIFS